VAVQKLVIPGPGPFGSGYAEYHLPFFIIIFHQQVPEKGRNVSMLIDHDPLINPVVACLVKIFTRAGITGNGFLHDAFIPGIEMKNEIGWL